MGGLGDGSAHARPRRVLGGVALVSAARGGGRGRRAVSPRGGESRRDGDDAVLRVLGGATLALGAAAADDEGGWAPRRWFERVRARRRASERARVRAPARGGSSWARSRRARRVAPRGDAAERRGAVRAGRAASPRGGQERRSASATGSARRRRPGVEELGTANGGGPERAPGVSRDGRDGSSESPRSSGSAEGSASSRGERFGRGGTDRSEPFGGGATSAARARAEDRSDFRTLADAEAGAGGDGADLSSGAFVGASSRVGAVRDGVSSGDRCRFRPSAASRGAAGTGAGAGTLANRGTPRGASSRGSTSRTPGKEAREGGG